jgi:rSAM/selenodomain-associated transferase 2
VISVIVPVLNEAKILPAALGELLEQEGLFEVIVVDGGSTDGSDELARQAAGVRCIVSERGRGTQMNAGAAAARGELFLFLHIDTRLPPGAILALQAAADGGMSAGAFRHSFAAADWRLRLISAGHNLQCRLTRIYYGDHAIFVRRDVFERVRGFPEVALLEDVVFCQRLRTVVRAALLPQVVTTDARRFLQHGVWRTMGRALLILARHALGLTPGERRSWDEVR